MKKFIFVFVILFGTPVIAQNKKDLFGSKAKNSKPWQKQKTTIKILANTFKKNNITGALYKNSKIWNKKISDDKIVISINSKRKKLQGPKAKNNKPWDN